MIITDTQSGATCSIKLCFVMSLWNMGDISHEHCELASAYLLLQYVVTLSYWLSGSQLWI